MNQPLKIAIYSGEIPSETFIERLIKGLSKQNQRIYLFGVKKKKIVRVPSVKIIGYTHNRFSKLLHLATYGLLLFLFRNKDKIKLDKILKSQSKNILYAKVKSYPVLWHKPDIFHLQWAKGLEEWFWVKDFGMQLVLSLRGAHINYSPIANNKLALMYLNYFPKVDGFHAVSKAIAKEAQKYGALEEKIKVVYSGLEIDDFIKKAKNQNHVFSIISVGRPHWIKGYTYALDACKILKQKNFNFEYSIIGGASDIELLYQVKDLELENHVKLYGQKPFDQVQEFIHSADLILLPSHKEGIANVVLEAMALKTIVLSTECGGIEEVIVHGENGFLTPIRNPNMMADQIIELSKLSQNEIATITTSALKTLKFQHNSEQMIQRMLELYRGISS
jgi:colanic acid/amylovoran biosynthesis glycosyltransferase